MESESVGSQKVREGKERYEPLLTRGLLTLAEFTK